MSKKLRTVGQKSLKRLYKQGGILLFFGMFLVFASLKTLQVWDFSITRKINYPQRKRAAC